MLSLSMNATRPSPQCSREQSLLKEHNAHHISVERPSGADAIKQRRLAPVRQTNSCNAGVELLTQFQLVNVSSDEDQATSLGSRLGSTVS